MPAVTVVALEHDGEGLRESDEMTAAQLLRLASIFSGDLGPGFERETAAAAAAGVYAPSAEEKRVLVAIAEMPPRSSDAVSAVSAADGAVPMVTGLREGSRDDEVASAQDRSGGPSPAHEAERAAEAPPSPHDAGTCRPCAFARSAQGCRGGAACAFCHEEHSGRTTSIRHRPCKGKRDRMKKAKAIANLEREVARDPDCLDHDRFQLLPSVLDSAPSARGERPMSRLSQVAAAIGQATSAGTGASAASSSQ